MADEEGNEEVTEEKPEEGSSGKSPLMLVLLLVNTLLMGFLAYMQWTQHKKLSSVSSVKDVMKADMKKAGAKKFGATKKEDGLLFPLETFTANLAQGDGPRRFLRLNAVLKFNKKASEKEFKARKPQIRDTIINILNSKRPKDLLNKEGKVFLKEEIKAAINTYLIDGHVMDVYYVGFQIN